jgi:hypothetical protein
MEKTQQPLKEQINNFINNWNNKYPIDLWWRKKYAISFGSEEHRKMTHLQMYIEYIESEKLRQYVNKGKSSKDSNDGDEYFNDKKIDLKEEKEIDDEYDNLDLSTFDRKEDGTN